MWPGQVKRGDRVDISCVSIAFLSFPPKGHVSGHVKCISFYSGFSNLNVDSSLHFKMSRGLSKEVRSKTDLGSQSLF